VVGGGGEALFVVESFGRPGVLTLVGSRATPAVPHEEEYGDEEEGDEGKDDEDEEEHEGGVGGGCWHGPVTPEEVGGEDGHIAVRQAFVLRVRVVRRLLCRIRCLRAHFSQTVDSNDCAAKPPGQPSNSLHPHLPTFAHESTHL